MAAFRRAEAIVVQDRIYAGIGHVLVVGQVVFRVEQRAVSEQI
jgi:hypothetical protein